METRRGSLGWSGALVANLLLIGVFAGFTVVRVYAEDVFYRSVQEDEALEWATFWAFLLAAGACALGAFRQWSSLRRLPWFLLGLGLFCLFVAMEEISWGQRVLGYQPPNYFLDSTRPGFGRGAVVQGPEPDCQPSRDLPARGVRARPR